MLIRMRKAQSTAEYAIVIGLVIAAAVAMQVYVKRSLQGKIRDASDYADADTPAALTATKQYEPYYLGSNMTATRNASSSENTSTDGGVNRQIIGNEVSTRTGVQTIGEVEE